MSVSGSNKIVLLGNYGHHGEGKLTAAAYPGMNVNLSVTASEFERHYYTPGSSDYAGTGTVSTTKNPLRVLKEDSLQGNTVDTQYASGAACFFYVPLPGDVLQVLVTSGETIAKGDGLSAASTGKWVNDNTNCAVEALEASGGALGADTLLRVRVL